MIPSNIAKLQAGRDNVLCETGLAQCLAKAVGSYLIYGYRMHNEKPQGCLSELQVLVTWKIDLYEVQVTQLFNCISERSCTFVECQH